MATLCARLSARYRAQHVPWPPLRRPLARCSWSLTFLPKRRTDPSKLLLRIQVARTLLSTFRSPQLSAKLRLITCRRLVFPPKDFSRTLKILVVPTTADDQHWKSFSVLWIGTLSTLEPTLISSPSKSCLCCYAQGCKNYWHSKALSYTHM